MESETWKKFISTIKDAYTFDLLTQEIKPRRGGSETITDKMLFTIVDSYGPPLEFINGIYGHPMFESLFHVFMSIYKSFNTNKIDAATQTEKDIDDVDSEIAFIKETIKYEQYIDTKFLQIYNTKFNKTYSLTEFRTKFGDLFKIQSNNQLVCRNIDGSTVRLFELKDTEKKIRTIKNYIDAIKQKFDSETRENKLIQLSKLCNEHFHRYDKHSYSFLEMLKNYNITI